MVIIGLWVRFRLVEATAFTKASDEKRLVKAPLGEVFRFHWKQIVLGVFYMLATYGIFYTVSTWGLTYGTKPSPAGLGNPDNPEVGAYGFVQFELLLIATCVLFGITTLLSGPLADRIGRRRFLIWVTLGIIVFGLVFQPLWSGGIVGTTLWLAIGFTLMGLTFGPQAALLPELFPTNVRYSGSGIAYNISSILGAAITPFVATALVASTQGQSWLVGLYLAGLAVLTLIALFLGKETKDIDIEH